MSLEVDMHLLIDLIQQYPHLYDIKDKNYKNNELKEKCWHAISTQVNISVDDCKRLWRNLRDRFNKEKRLHPDSESSESTWPYFSKMLFYAKYSTPRRTVVATSRASTERPGSSTSDSHLWSNFELLSSDVEPGSKEQEEFASTTTPEAQHTISYDSTREWESGPNSKRIKQEHLLQEYEDVAIPVASHTLVSRNDVNETFGAYVVSRLKEMDPEIAKQKRKKMLSVLEDD